MTQEYTNYQFDCKPAALHGALERFAQFFIAPLCKEDALEREVMAVNNEFTGVLLATHIYERLKFLALLLISGVPALEIPQINAIFKVPP